MSASLPSTSPAGSGTEPRLRRIFLTGGSGYIGRNIVRHFVALGVEVHAIARSARAYDLLRSLGAQPVEGDLFSSHLPSAMKGCDALVHVAADTQHGMASKVQRRVNVEGTRSVFSAAAQAQIARAVHLSTESVLLDGRPLVNVTEDRPYPARPAGSYSATKAEAEKIAIAAARDGMGVCVVRPRFVWGRDDTTALPQLLAAVDAGKFAWIGGGHYRTSTTHISNLVHGIERALLVGRPGQCYFISDADVVEFRTFISAMLATQGRSVTDKEVPRGLVYAIALISEGIASLTGGRWHPPVTRQTLATSAVEVTLNISKALDELGYAPVVSRDQGLAELALLYQAQSGATA